ncbi:MAG: COX15/CtaA family protein [Saprospiraceae bacterium]|nr:COX15/CtaA family protein [Saprospiraceae bacterium]
MGMHWLKYWLFTGLVLVFFQVVIGGITRLTESGLSITKWEVVAGTFPPIGEKEWNEAFELYKQTPQYSKINKGMDIGSFKFIYFWEYIHRLWARIMGFVFLVPFLFFFREKMIDGHLMRRLGLVILMAFFAATFGWIMVASGLVDRPWVSAYKLSFHLCIAFLVYSSLLWTYLEFVHGTQVKILRRGHIMSFVFLLVLWIQLFVGGMMSGMKAGLFFPSWPDMNGVIIPQVIFHAKNWNVESFLNYDQNLRMPALVQLVHRTTAYFLFFYGLYIFLRYWHDEKYAPTRIVLKWFTGLLITQVLLGIITVVLCKGEVPVLWGVLHQAGALALLTVTLVLRFKIKLMRL